MISLNESGLSMNVSVGFPVSSVYERLIKEMSDRLELQNIIMSLDASANVVNIILVFSSSAIALLSALVKQNAI